ncbi:PREDICTED: degenerin unc-8-like [Priapulus caudatus]|uniref:Degenerin unc-8-like n=1 Tax=Priapulus caudatus TaxID=37621 RepID=A0ABM1F435_PRICU|nr:PREDICTED: degenerin unc-8-like [Priapulus caudatus]
MVREGSPAVHKTLAMWLNTSESALKSGAECLIEKSNCTDDSYDFIDTSDDSTYFLAVAAGRSNFLKISVYYKDMKFKSTKLQKAYTWVSFLAELGGMFGLCIGFSLLTFVEVLELPVLLLHIWVCGGANKVGEKPTTIQINVKNNVGEV